jgi:hypothetical protein
MDKPENNEENRGACICPHCPLYTSCNDGKGEKFFCGSDESACTMDSTENCICPGCAVFDEYELEFGYFCLNAIEEKGRDEE